MQLNEKDYLKIVNSEQDMLFAYDMTTNKVYLSQMLQQEFKCSQIINHYWRESANWHWVEQRYQEELVNLLRHEIFGNGPISYLLPIRKNNLEETLYHMELELIWKEGSKTQFIGVVGKIWPK